MKVAVADNATARRRFNNIEVVQGAMTVPAEQRRNGPALEQDRFESAGTSGSSQQPE